MSRKGTLWACDFCGKDQDGILKIVAGPGVNAICNECIEQCWHIILGPTDGEREYLSWLHPTSKGDDNG